LQRKALRCRHPLGLGLDVEALGLGLGLDVEALGLGLDVEALGLGLDVEALGLGLDVEALGLGNYGATTRRKASPWNASRPCPPYRAVRHARRAVAPLAMSLHKRERPGGCRAVSSRRGRRG
jgi:hypothetical protein